MIHFYDISKIKVNPDRQRQEFDGESMAELSDSITRIGLLHPLIIEADGTLRTGERRLRAITNLNIMGISIMFNQSLVSSGQVPVLIYDELTEIERMEIEYDENHKRKDLSWQESARATALLVALRNAQAGQEGTAAPTIGEIAVEVRGISSADSGKALTETREALIVARYLNNPEVAKAKTQKEAIKILKKAEVQRRNEVHAGVIGKTYSIGDHRAFNENCVDWMHACPDAQFDLICTDPPYGMGADEFGDSGVGASAHNYSDAWDDVQTTLYSIIREGFRVTKPQAHIYMFCDIDHFHDLRRFAEQCGWQVFRTPMIWRKLNAFRVPWPEHGPRRSYETILYAIKGKKPVTAIYDDVLTHEDVSSKSVYAAQKPVSLIADLIKRSCRPGEKILDPCMGSGTIFEAATIHKCVATGIEQLPEPYGIAVKRLEELK